MKIPSCKQGKKILNNLHIFTNAKNWQMKLRNYVWLLDATLTKANTQEQCLNS